MDRLQRLLKIITAVEDEELDPWQELWRRAKFFFETDEQFRHTCLSSFIIIFVSILAVIVWVVVLYRRKKYNLEAEATMVILASIEENRESLQEIEQLLKRQAPEPVDVPLPLPIAESAHPHEATRQDKPITDAVRENPRHNSELTGRSSLPRPIQPSKVPVMTDTRQPVKKRSAKRIVSTK